MLNINRKDGRKRHTAPEPSKLSLDLLGEHRHEDLAGVAWSSAPRAEDSDAYCGVQPAAVGSSASWNSFLGACGIRRCEIGNSLVCRDGEQSESEPEGC